MVFYNKMANGAYDINVYPQKLTDRDQNRSGVPVSQEPIAFSKILIAASVLGGKLPDATVVADNNATRINRIGYGTTNTLQGNVDFESPFLAKNTIIRASFLSQVTGGDGGTYVGFLNNSTSYTDFTINSFGGATMTGGTIQVFGYRKAI
jgi:hypothetical protein